MLIRNYGLFWEEDSVFWGGPGESGELLGSLSTRTTAEPVDFREQSGIYVLYSNYKFLYVGQAGIGNAKLFARLKKHRTDDLAKRWNQFSWFGLRRVLGSGELAVEAQAAHPSIDDVLNHMEAILIAAVEPPLNRQGGRFGENCERYLQAKDQRFTDVTEVVLDLQEKLGQLEKTLGKLTGRAGA